MNIFSDEVVRIHFNPSGEHRSIACIAQKAVRFRCILLKRRKKTKEKGTSGTQAARGELGGRTASGAEGQKNHPGARSRTGVIDRVGQRAQQRHNCDSQDDQE